MWTTIHALLTTPLFLHLPVDRILTMAAMSAPLVQHKPLTAPTDSQEYFLDSFLRLEQMLTSIPDAPKTRRNTARTTRHEIPFPIFNRKAGLCGLHVPSFFTFCTAVDIPVDRQTLFPAQCRSFSLEGIPRQRQPRTKGLQFPHFNPRVACGKTAVPWVQWRRVSDTFPISATQLDPRGPVDP